MPTPQYTVRIPDNVKEPADRKRDALGLTFTDAVNDALQQWTGGDDATIRESAIAIQTLKAELAQAREELATVRAGLAGISPAPYEGAGDKEHALAYALATSSPASPATRKNLAVLSGYREQHIGSYLTALAAAGYVTRESGKYVPVPGADMLQGVIEARRAVSARSTARQVKAGLIPAPGASPETAPAKPATARTAPRNPAAVAQAAREAGHDVKPANELPAPVAGAAMFQAPGADKVVVPVPERKKRGGSSGARKHESASDMAAAVIGRTRGGSR